MSIKVSIVVPVYNVEKYLRRCLDSLVNQTLQDIEIIVVNDGTKDNSQVIIDEYVEKYPNKVYGYIKENGGLSDARNYGMQYVKGEYVAFVDSDDYVDVTMYEKLYNKAMEEGSEIVTCAYFKVNDANNTMYSAQKGKMGYYNASARENKEIVEISAPYAWNKLVKKDLLDRTKILFPKGYIYEDICTMYPLLACAEKISKVDEELYYYIVEREDSITATFNKSKTLIIKSLELLNHRFKELGLFDEFRDQLVVITLRHIYFRFGEFHRYKDRKHQIKLVNQSFKLLNKYFPDWRKNSGSYIYFTLAKDRNIKRWFYKRRLYWIMVALMPLNWIINYREWDYRKRHPGRDLKREYVSYLETEKVKSNRVLIESFHGKNISDSPYYIMKDLLKRGGYEIYVTSTKNAWDENEAFIKKNKFNVKMVQLGTKEYYKVLATAKYLVNNVSFPLCFVTRDEQIYLNTWHGTPLKTLGKNMRKGIESMYNIQHNFLQSTYMLFPNEFTKNCMMEDYNLEKLYTHKTIVAGYPRNAIFKDKEAGQEVKEKLGLKGKTVYAYMPTWRGVNSYGQMSTTDIAYILEQMDKSLDEEHLLYVNLHPNVGDEIDYSEYKYIDKFPAEIPNYEFVNCVDALITDYSSIFFDFSITRKPIVLFMYDFEEYMQDRGMYTDIQDLPFKKIYNIQDMCEALKKDELVTYSYDDAKEYFDKYTKYDSIDATEKLVDYIFYNKDSGLSVQDYSANGEKEWRICIQPSRIDAKEEFDEFVAGQDADNTIFVIKNDYFHALMNKWFFEEYNAKLTYVIFGYSRLITEKEEEIFLTEDEEHKPERKKIKKKAREMAYRRTLPGINIINKHESKRII